MKADILVIVFVSRLIHMYPRIYANTNICDCKHNLHWVNPQQLEFEIKCLYWGGTGIHHGEPQKLIAALLQSSIPLLPFTICTCCWKEPWPSIPNVIPVNKEWSCQWGLLVVNTTSQVVSKSESFFTGLYLQHTYGLGTRTYGVATRTYSILTV